MVVACECCLVFKRITSFQLLIYQNCLFCPKKTSQLLIFSRFVAYFFNKWLVSCLIFLKVWLVSKMLLIERCLQNKLSVFVILASIQVSTRLHLRTSYQWSKNILTVISTAEETISIIFLSIYCKSAFSVICNQKYESKNVFLYRWVIWKRKGWRFDFRGPYLFWQRGIDCIYVKFKCWFECSKSCMSQGSKKPI